MGYWGVNSWNRANARIGRRTLFDIVRRHAGEVPDFWGRYIGVGPQTTAPPLTPQEARWIFEQSGHRCRILLIYNGVGSQTVTGSFADGVTAADDALARAAAAGLAADQRARIYMDIEPAWRPSADFLLGWWEGMRRSSAPGMGGIYANPDQHAIRRAYFAALERLSHRDRSLYDRYHWSTRPGLGCHRNPARMRDVWRPRRFGLHGVRPGVSIPVPGPMPEWTDPITIWQFARNCLGRHAGGHGLADFNIADRFGMADLWSSRLEPADLRVARSIG